MPKDNNNVFSEQTQDFVNQSIEKQIEDMYKDIEEEEIVLEDFNELQLYFGDDYTIGKFTIHQPTIQDFITYGEKNIYGTIAPFTSNTTTYRVQLWDAGFDWNKVSDWELFALLIKTMNFEYSKIIFGDIDFSKFEMYPLTDAKTSKDFILYNEELDIMIDEDLYKKLAKYIRYMFNTEPEEEFTKGKSLKRALIQKDRLEAAKRAKEESKSSLRRMISFALNHPGFKYNKEQVRNCGIVEFMDSIQQLQIYESTRALYGGMYSGFCDLSKIDKDNFNFMRKF